MSRVNSKSSHNVARERVRLKIKIAARNGFVLMREVLCKTWMKFRAMNPRARDAVNVMMKLHQIEPEYNPLSSPRVRSP